MDASARLHEIAARLTDAGDGAAFRKVAAAMREAAKPLPLYTARAALEQLPHKGGLDRRVADEHVTVSIRTGAQTAGVSLIMRHHDAATTDLGYVRHPTFGHDPWRTEEIPRARGWWSDTLERHSHEITPYILQAMEETAREIQR